MIGQTLSFLSGPGLQALASPLAMRFCDCSSGQFLFLLVLVKFLVLVRW